MRCLSCCPSIPPNTNLSIYTHLPYPSITNHTNISIPPPTPPPRVPPNHTPIRQRIHSPKTTFHIPIPIFPLPMTLFPSRGTMFLNHHHLITFPSKRRPARLPRFFNYYAFAADWRWFADDADGGGRAGACCFADFYSLYVVEWCC